MRKKYLCRKTIRGKVRWFVRRKIDGKEHYTEIHAEPGTREFDSAYWAVLNEDQQPKPSRTSWGALIKAYRASPKFKRLKASTQQDYDLYFNRILDKNRAKDVRKTTRAGVRAFHEAYADTPAAADRLVAVIRMLLTYARVELEWVNKNVAEGLEKHGPKDRTRAWPVAAQRAFLSACNEMREDDARTMFMLGCGTGQRAGDLLSMQWKHYDGEFISVIQEKTGTRLDVYCPARLRAYLDALPRRGEYILARDLRNPMTYDQLHKRVMRVRRKAGLLHLRIHGWRATAAVELREAGNELATIAAVTGHKDMSMVLHYTRDIDQRKLSREAQEKRK